MAQEIIWTKRADQKFDKIIEYLMKEWGDKVTVGFVKRVFDFIDILKEFPEIGSIENNKRKIRGFFLIKQIMRIKGWMILIISNCFIRSTHFGVVFGIYFANPELRTGLFTLLSFGQSYPPEADIT